MIFRTPLKDFRPLETLQEKRVSVQLGRCTGLKPPVISHDVGRRSDKMKIGRVMENEKTKSPEKKDYISGAASGLVTGIGITVIFIIKSMTWDFNMYFIWGSLTFIVVCGVLGALFGDKIIEKLTNMI